MAKTKFKDFEDAKNIKASTKEELEVAKGELKAFMKENKIAKDTKPEDVKDGKVSKAYGKLLTSVESKRAVIAEANEFMEGNKPKKEKTPRATKYEYPANATSEEKKKIRAAGRAAAKKAAKGEKTEKPAKKAKVEEAEAPKKDKKKDKNKNKAKSED